MTKTEIEHGLDIESIEALDLEFEEPCDYGKMYGAGCQNAATWRIVVSCCGGVILFCQQHFDFILDAIAGDQNIWCNLCETSHSPGSKAIASAERIDRHSKV